jgi:hypothetical protein
MRIRTILAAAVAPLAVGGVLLTTTAASAATGPQQYVTHFNQHPDTADSALLQNQGATLSSVDGPVWAFDNTTVKLTVTPESLPNGDNWHVDVATTGSFHGFADPTTGAALVSDGSTKGQTSFDVNSPTGPDGANLPAQQPLPTVDPSQPYSSYQQVVIPTGLGSAVQALFPNGTIDWTTSEASYTFSYQNGNFTQVQVASKPYVQTGDVQGHSA